MSKATAPPNHSLSTIQPTTGGVGLGMKLPLPVTILGSSSFLFQFQEKIFMPPQVICENPCLIIGLVMEEQQQDATSSTYFPLFPSINSTSTCGTHQDIQNLSPQLFQNIQPAAELIREIAALEQEIINIERYLLSLYRSAFDKYLVKSTSTCQDRLSAECQSLSKVKDYGMLVTHETTPSFDYEQGQPVEKDHSSKHGKAEARTNTINKMVENMPFHNMAEGSTNSVPSIQHDRDVPKPVSGYRSLADHLGTSLMDTIHLNPCQLSEEIVRCIAAIYCKLTSPIEQPIDKLIRISPSASSSSTFSPQDPNDTWSPRCHYDAIASPRLPDSLRYKQNPYNSMLEISMISIDGSRFGFASKMLNLYRSLIKCLENVDPRNMEHEGQLAFWINIHNALAMHAFLAFGMHQNQMKTTYSIIKAAYNVGGHSLNAYDIQSSILQCESHSPTLWFRGFFTSRIVKGKGKHPYALAQVEPLVHFALCLGAYSDPAVRTYHARNLMQELKIAQQEYIQANVWIPKEKIFVPKLLQNYAKDAYLELPGLLEVIKNCMPEFLRREMQACLRRKIDKCIEWSPSKSTFRYILHQDFADYEEPDILNTQIQLKYTTNSPLHSF